MEFLHDNLLKDLKAAGLRQARRRARRRIHAGSEVWPILREWAGGFALDASQIETLRGLVEVHEAGRHVSSCLIVASEVVGGELICLLKSELPVADRPALDFERDAAAPVALLPRT